MSERTSTAFFLSLLLHGAAVAAIFALAFAVQQRKPPPVMVFDLVAGPGNDLGATAAPALGSPDGDFKVKVHEPPGRVPVIPVAPEEPAPPAPTRAETRAAAAEKARAAEKPATPAEARMTYEQYVKKYGVPRSSKAGTSRSPRPIAVPRINGRGIAEGVEGGSPDSTRGAGGTAMTSAMHSELDAYVSRLVAALRQNHEKPPGLSDLLAADVEFFIAADGSLSHIRIARSSGNAAFDASCIEAFRRVGSVGPKPDGKSATWVLTFRMKDE